MGRQRGGVDNGPGEEEAKVDDVIWVGASVCLTDAMMDH
jgi:hypothetical protein